MLELHRDRTGFSFRTVFAFAVRFDYAEGSARVQVGIYRDKSGALGRGPRSATWRTFPTDGEALYDRLHRNEASGQIYCDEDI